VTLGERPETLAIARIARPRGNKGEVIADLHTDFPDRFDGLSEVWLSWPDGRRERRVLTGSWPHQGRRVLKFEGADTISDAEPLAGAWVEIEAEQAVELPGGVYFDHDLVGCAVVDGAGRDLGVVSGIERFPGNPQMVVRAGSGEFLLPAGGSFFLDVSIEHKRIVVDLPEGLVDLNR